jgi:phenylpropionate dioxygenase-like ring-hydroxylating dioxygenase large terminal subunit
VQGSGDGLTAFACPYHGWTYRLDGTLVARPASAGAFDDVTLDCALHRVAIAERHGLVFVRAEGDGPIDIDDTLGGLADDLAGYELARYVPVETRTNRWAVNWKMIIDTFMEQYHIRWLHRNSIAPSFLSYSTLFDAFGANGRIIGLQRDVMQEIEKPRDERRLIPCSTIQYNLVPRALLVHQIDHLELWRINPLGVASTETVTSVFAPESPPTEKARNYFIKNLDLLLRVTGSEDFPMMERIQHALQSQRLPEVVYGRIEPGLVHFHKSVNALLEEAAAS